MVPPDIAEVSFLPAAQVGVLLALLPTDAEVLQVRLRTDCTATPHISVWWSEAEQLVYVLGIDYDEPAASIERYDVSQPADCYYADASANADSCEEGFWIATRNGDVDRHTILPVMMDYV